MSSIPSGVKRMRRSARRTDPESPHGANADEPQGGDRILEVHYLSQEVGLAEMMWMMAAIPEAARNTLLAYLNEVADPEAIAATRETSGRLILEVRSRDQR